MTSVFKVSKEFNIKKDMIFFLKTWINFYNPGGIPNARLNGQFNCKENS